MQIVNYDFVLKHSTILYHTQNPLKWLVINSYIKLLIMVCYIHQYITYAFSSKAERFCLSTTGKDVLL